MARPTSACHTSLSVWNMHRLRSCSFVSLSCPIPTAIIDSQALKR